MDAHISGVGMSDGDHHFSRGSRSLLIGGRPALVETSRHGNALLKSLVSAADESAEVREKVGKFWRERLDAGAAVLSRAVGRGEVLRA